MKKLHLLKWVLSITFLALSWEASAIDMTKTPAELTAPDYRPGIVRHVVLFRYAENLDPKTRVQITNQFLALQNTCLRNGKPYLLSIEVGDQNSGEGANQGLEQGYLVSFRSEGDRNYYVGQPVIKDPQFYDPSHQKFKDALGPLLIKNALALLVFDFTVERATMLGIPFLPISLPEPKY